MFTSVYTTVLPDFSIDVRPLAEDPARPAPQRHVLVLGDAATGMIELVFPSPQEFSAFLVCARNAFNNARQMARRRRIAMHPPRRPARVPSPY